MTASGGDPWGINQIQSDRAKAVTMLGFTERQARFLVTVMLHSGVFVQRQYCAFAGITHGQKTHDFIGRLVRRGFAREIRPGALHRGRLYHLHHKRLYTAINQPDNRNRRQAPLGRMVERLMLLDAVLDDRQVMWLAAEKDKTRYFALLLQEYRFLREELPHLSFGRAPRRTLRMFPDKLPIGVEPACDRHVFLYLLKRSVPVDLRAFLARHFTLLKPLHRWTIRVLVPRRFVKAIPVYRHTLYEELATPLRPSEADELGWHFEQRRHANKGSATCDPRFVEAAKRFSAPRFRALYRLWLQHGDSVLWNTYSTLLADKFERGEAKVEFVVLSRQYLHLSPLVGVPEGAERGDNHGAGRLSPCAAVAVASTPSER